MNLDETQSVLATVIRQYGENDELLVSREVFETLPQRLKISVLSTGNDEKEILLKVEGAPAKPGLHVIGGKDYED